MFDKLTDMIENALDVGVSIVTLEGLDKRKVAKLIADGLSVWAIASMFGVGVDVIEDMMK